MTERLCRTPMWGEGSEEPLRGLKEGYSETKLAFGVEGKRHL